MNVGRLTITVLLAGTAAATAPTTTATQGGPAPLTESDGGVPAWAWILISAAVLIAGALIAARLTGGPRDH